MPILAKKKLFRWSSFWSWRVCKQAKLSLSGHRKPSRIHWKANAPKTNHCGIIRPFFFENEQAEAVTVNGDRYRAMMNEFLFTIVEDKWQHLVSTGRRYVPHSRSYTWCFKPSFWRSLYQPQSRCLLATSELGFDSPTIICHLAISEMRFDVVGLLFVGWRQARDNWQFKGQYSWSHRWNTAAHKRYCLKNWTDLVGYCMTRRSSHLNAITLHY